MHEAGFPKDSLFQHQLAPSVFLETSPKHRAVSRTPAYPVFGARKA
jgi:hypothetical protein